MPYPIRRACAKCVQAKRKCDLSHPRCKRCEKKSLGCSYGLQSPREATPQTIPRPIAPTATLPTSSSIWSPTATLPRLLDAPIDQSDITMGLDPIDNFDVSVDWLATGRNFASVDFDDFIERSDLPSQIPKITVDDAHIYKSRVAYTISRIQGWPTMFARRSTTPFVHRSFLSGYGRDNRVDDRDGSKSSKDVMLDALSACALYSVINEENRGAVLEDVRRKSKALIERMGPGREGGPEQILSALQALLLYQIIRLFDGEVRLRTEAEADEAVLARWTGELLKYLRPLKSLHATTNGLVTHENETQLSSMTDWRTWVFEESVRRTVLVSIMIQMNYACLSGKPTLHCLTETDNASFTAHQDLWEAPSEYHWNSLWAEKLPYTASAAHWDNLMARIGVNEADELVVIMLTLLHGLDHAAQWLGKENLKSYGLDWESMYKYLA